MFNERFSMIAIRANNMESILIMTIMHEGDATTALSTRICLSVNPWGPLMCDPNKVLLSPKAMPFAFDHSRNYSLRQGNAFNT